MAVHRVNVAVGFSGTCDVWILTHVNDRPDRPI